MNISPTALALIVALSTLTGVIITSIFNLLTTRITNKSDERKHQRELIMNAAITNWKQACEYSKETKDPNIVVPLDDYIIHMVKLSELVMDEKLDASNIEQKLSEVNDFTNKLIEYRKQKYKEEEKLRRI